MAQPLPEQQPALSATPTLLAAWFCPFAQRTLICANAKRPAFEFKLNEISHDDLYSKPQWFKALNPAGLIPVVAFRTTDGRTIPAPAAGAAPGVVAIRESLLCNEWLEDAVPQPALLPRDPVDRAAARLVIDRFSSRFVPAFYKILVQQDKAVQAAAAQQLAAELEWLALTGLALPGPLALGPELSLVDCALVPFLLRLYVLEHYRGFTMPAAAAARIEAYLAAAKAHPAIADTLYTPDGKPYFDALLGSYSRYADGSADSLMAREARADAKK